MDSSYLVEHFKERGFATYIIYFIVDIGMEFFIMMVVMIYLKRNSFYVSFSSLINKLQVKLHSKLGL